MRTFGSLAFAYALPLDGHTPGLKLAAQHRPRGRDRGGVMLRRIEQELAFQIHVELAGALQVPFQPLRRQLVLAHFAGRINGAADGAEGLFKVRHVGGRQAASALLFASCHSVNAGPAENTPWSGLAAVGPGDWGAQAND